MRTANFITESIARRLDVHVTKYLSPVGTINTINTESKGIVQITFRQCAFSKNLICLLIPAISDSETFPQNAIKISTNINLAGPEFHILRPLIY